MTKFPFIDCVTRHLSGSNYLKKVKCARLLKWNDYVFLDRKVWIFYDFSNSLRHFGTLLQTKIGIIMILVFKVNV